MHGTLGMAHGEGHAVGVDEKMHRCFVLTRGAQVPRVRALECSSETTFLTLRDVSPAKVRGTHVPRAEPRHSTPQVPRLTCDGGFSVGLRLTRRPKCPD